jgi:hypothetical protein
VRQPTVCADMLANARVCIRTEMLAVHSLGDPSANCCGIKGLALAGMHRLDEALRVYDHALSLFPNDAGLWAG